MDMKNSDEAFSQIVKVYSGKPGCACGCRGKYTYVDGAAGESNGWPASSKSRRMAQVRKVFNIVTAARDGWGAGSFDFGKSYMAARVNGRDYVVYFED